MIKLIAILSSYIVSISTPLTPLQFSPQNAWLLSFGQANTIAVEFNKDPSLTIGSPVLFRGQLVGAVKSIAAVKEKEAIEVVLSLSAVDVREGTMALVSSAWLSSDKRPDTFVELLSPEDESAAKHQPARPIRGFATFQEFWSADTAHPWIDAQETPEARLS